MTKKNENTKGSVAIIIAVVGGVLLIALGWYLLYKTHENSVVLSNPLVSTSTPLATAPTSTASASPESLVSSTQPAQTGTPSADNSSSSQPIAYTYVIHANDSGADLTQLLVPRGDTIRATFYVNATGSNPEGIDFRGPGTIETGVIKPGESRSVIIQSDNSFDIIPYISTTSTSLPYVISYVDVEGIFDPVP